jgi:hypothetical protein
MYSRGDVRASISDRVGPNVACARKREAVDRGLEGSAGSGSVRKKEEEGTVTVQCGLGEVDSEQSKVRRRGCLRKVGRERG